MSDIQGVTETGDVSSSVILAGLVQKELRARAVVAPSLLDVTSEIRMGMKEAPIPRATSLTAEEKAENTDLTAQKLDWSVDTLLLNVHLASLVSAEDISSIQSEVDQEFYIMQRIASSIVDKMEQKLIAEVYLTADGTGGLPDHQINYATAGVLALSDILEAGILLDEQNVPEEDRFCLISPRQKKQVLQIEQLIDTSRYGSDRAIMKGEIGEIYGFRFLVSSLATNGTSAFYQREHVAHGLQLAMQMEMDRNLAQVATEYLGQTIMGKKVLDQGKRGLIIT